MLTNTPTKLSWSRPTQGTDGQFCNNPVLTVEFRGDTGDLMAKRTLSPKELLAGVQQDEKLSDDGAINDDHDDDEDDESDVKSAHDNSFGNGNEEVSDYLCTLFDIIVWQ